MQETLLYAHYYYSSDTRNTMFPKILIYYVIAIVMGKVQ